jgi:ABC-2 type transport system ATP-binding protein
VPIVRADGLTKVFAVRRRSREAGVLRRVSGELVRTTAVDRVSFEIEPGSVVGYIGPNGAGKSTTIKMLTGILHPSQGEATVLGLVPWRQRRQLAYQMAAVFGQKSQLWYHLPPQATFDLLARVYDLPPEEYRRRAAELIELFDLRSHLQTPVRRLSLGERMRCELAAALLHRPRVLFLDEPTIGLDVVSKGRLRDFLRRINAERGTTIVLTTHYLEEAERLCDRVAIIHAGAIVALDTPAALLAGLGGELLELRVEGDVSAALGALGVAGRDDSYVVGSTLTLPLRDASAGDAIAAIHDAGIATSAISTRRPTLDDIYLRLTGEGLPAAA